MKNKFVLSMIILLSIFAITGCGEKKETANNEDDKSNTKIDYVLFRCGVGNADISVHYEEYKMKGNDFLEYKEYDENKYNSKEEMEKDYNMYKGFGIYEVEKVSDTELKIIDKDPTNIYAMGQIENGYEEIIENSKKHGSFCQISEDGKTFAKVENNLSKKDSERNAWNSSVYDLGDDYDSEIFYVPNADITYKITDGFKTKEKDTGKQSIEEVFNRIDSTNNINAINVYVKGTSYNGTARDGHSKGADSASYFQRKFDLDYSSKNQASEIKTAKVGKYNVYYFQAIDYVVSDMPGTYTYMFFDISDDYFIEIDINYASKVNYDDIKNNDISSFENLIKSFEIKNIN